MKKLFALLLVLLVALCFSVPLVTAAEAPPAEPPETAQVVFLEPTDAPMVATATTAAQETDPGGIVGFLSWSILATYAGALAFVLAVTQFTKGLAFIDRMPTQIWSWIVAMVGMYLGYYFTGQLSVNTAALIPINAVLVALAANGGFEALSRLFKTT